MPEVVLDGFFRGPPTSSNGGYAAGVAAELLGEPARVSVRKPPPIDRPLGVRRTDAGVEIVDGDEVVLAAKPRGPLDVTVPPIDLAAARTASAPSALLESHRAPTCVVCGPGRTDGFRIFPGRLGPGIVATSWRVPEIERQPGGEVSVPVVWAAMDCPGAFSFEGSGTEFFPALVSQSVEILEPIRPGTEVIIVGWETGRDDRKLSACTAILDLQGAPLAVCEQRCIAVDPTWAQ